MQRRVLLVEDNEVTRKLVRFALEADGFEVREVARGKLALDDARGQPPDLVLQDVILPDIDGFALFESLRDELGPQVPILAFTGLLSSVDEKRLGTAAFDDVISKPIEPSRLREIVRAYFPERGSTSSSFGTGRTMLLADDDAVQRKLAAFRLSRLGFNVLTASDGEEALGVARAKRPDVIVSDVLMPRMDGFELCSQIRNDPELGSTPLVLMTNSYLEESDRALAKRVGADGYVVRTPELNELREVLEPLVSSPRARAPAVTAHARGEIHRDRIDRALKQLDRQVAINATLTQRSAMLAAEITILGGLTRALAEQRDIDAALDTALSACFDAGGISWGVLLVRRSGGWDRRSVGIPEGAERWVAPMGDQLAERLQGRGREPARVRLGELGGSVEHGGDEALVAPIVHRGETLGFLLLGAGATLDEHRIAFAGVVAGQIALVLALSRTFRELAEASHAERARARLLGSILDSIGDPILVIDHSYRISLSNAAAEREGLTRPLTSPETWPEELGFYQTDQTTPYAWDRLPLIRALRGESIDEAEIYLRREGSAGPRWLRMHAKPVLGDGDEIEAAVSVVRDVTAEKAAQAHQILADRMASIGMLAAGVAHEINNPLTAVIAELDMAVDDVGEMHPALDGLNAARDAAERVRTIVQDLKTLSRGETDEVAPVDVVRVLDASIRMATPVTRMRATVRCSYEDVPVVIANESRLGQVFLNLIVNAAQAIVPGADREQRIDVVARREGDELVVEIVDTGTGMTPEVRDRLFTPFFTTKPIGTGTGLGLAISQRIVSNAGGRIEVESVVGSGSTFRVRLPAAPSAKAAGT